jgi:hypothetical protein
MTTPVSTLSLLQLLAEAGPAQKRVEQVLSEVAVALLEARLVIDEHQWHRVSENDGAAMEFLTASLGAPASSWDTDHVLGDRALETLRSINRRAHAWAITRGGAKYRALVIQAQGGEFCSVCGARSLLAVDHIIPVSVGGAQDVLTNMQLLCETCNAGKSNLRDRLLPMAISLRTTREISAGLRFKHLLLDSVQVDGRTRGVCSCGRHAGTVQLHIKVQPGAAAANLLTLLTRCTDCDLQEH